MKLLKVISFLLFTKGSEMNSQSENIPVSSGKEKIKKKINFKKKWTCLVLFFKIFEENFDEKCPMKGHFPSPKMVVREPKASELNLSLAKLRKFRRNLLQNTWSNQVTGIPKMPKQNPFSSEFFTWRISSEIRQGKLLGKFSSSENLRCRAAQKQTMLFALSRKNFERNFLQSTC